MGTGRRVDTGRGRGTPSHTQLHLHSGCPRVGERAVEGLASPEGLTQCTEGETGTQVGDVLWFCLVLVLSDSSVLLSPNKHKVPGSWAVNDRSQPPLCCTCPHPVSPPTKTCWKRERFAEHPSQGRLPPAPRPPAQWAVIPPPAHPEGWLTAGLWQNQRQRSGWERKLGEMGDDNGCLT